MAGICLSHSLESSSSGDWLLRTSASPTDQNHLTVHLQGENKPALTASDPTLRVPLSVPGSKSSVLSIDSDTHLAVQRAMQMSGDPAFNGSLYKKSRLFLVPDTGD